MEVAGVLHARARADAVPALLPGGRGARVPLRNGGARQPDPALDHRRRLSVLAAIALAGAAPGQPPRAVRLHAVLEPGAPDRVLQLRRRHAAPALGARARLARGRVAFAPDSLDAVGGGGRALLPAPVGVRVLRTRGCAGLRRLAPPRPLARLAAEAPLGGAHRRALRSLAGEQSGRHPQMVGWRQPMALSWEQPATSLRNVFDALLDIWRGPEDEWCLLALLAAAALLAWPQRRAPRSIPGGAGSWRCGSVGPRFSISPFPSQSGGCGSSTSGMR